MSEFLELFTFRTQNNPQSVSRLEQVLDGRDTSTMDFGPLRSNRGPQWESYTAPPLSNGAADLQPRIVASIYQVRARANAARGNFGAAYSDLNEYTTRYVAVDEARRAREIAGHRARFETDRQIERNADLHRELELSQQRQR